MEMTNYEIARSYRESKEHRKQIGILADLNCCSAAKIRDILRSEGIVLPGGVPKAPKKIDKEKTSDVKAELQDVKAESDVKVTADKIEPVSQTEARPKKVPVPEIVLKNTRDRIMELGVRIAELKEEMSALTEWYISVSPDEGLCCKEVMNEDGN